VKAVAGHNLARSHVLSFHQLKDHRRYSPVGALGLLPIVGESDRKQLVQVRISQRFSTVADTGKSPVSVVARMLVKTLESP
jgi:hypothetical protein